MEASRRHIFSGALIEELAGYARAVVVGDQIYVSAVEGLDPATGELADGVEAQAEHALDGISAALDQADSGLHDVVRVRTYLADVGVAKAVSKVLKQRIGMYYPALTMIGAALTSPGGLIEIEVEAIRGSGQPLA